MKDTFNHAIKILKASEAVRDFALIGKLALVPQVASITSTLDIDFLAILIDPELFEEELKQYGFQVGRVDLPEGGLLIRFWEEDRKIPIDVFNATSQWQEKIIQDALRIKFMNQEVPIARKEGVLVLKIAFFRDFKDRETVRMLLEDPQLDRRYFWQLLTEANLTERFESIVKRVGVKGWQTKEPNAQGNYKCIPPCDPGL